MPDIHGCLGKVRRARLTAASTLQGEYMGLGNWVRQAFGTNPARAVPPREPASPSEAPVGLRGTISTGTALCVELAGTTTFTKDAVAALADRHKLGTRGYFEGPAQLQREPDNPADPHAVAVIVEGEKVGYLPSPVNRGTGRKPGASAPATYQLHVLREAKLKAKAFVWLGDGHPEWDHTEDNPPGLTTAERANESHRDKSGMVREALASGGTRAAQFKRGMVDGVHYLELVEPIKQLKREGRLDEALALCYKAIEAAEGNAEGREPAPWYTEQAAIIHRKLSQKKTRKLRC